MPPKPASSGDSSSDSEDDLAKFAGVAVSAEEVTRAQQRIAQQGQQKLTKTTVAPAKPAAQAAHASEDVPDQGDEEDAKTGEAAPLGIIEARIAAALNQRLERLLPAVFTQSQPEVTHKSKAPATSARSPDEEGLGCGVRLFRKCKPGTPVTLPPDVLAALSQKKRKLVEELCEGMTAKRIRAEVRLLQVLLLPEQASVHQPDQAAAGLQPPGHATGTGRIAQLEGSVEGTGRPQDATKGSATAVPAEAAQEYQAALQRAIKQLSAVLQEPSKQAKAIKKALKQLAVEGAEIIQQAAVPEQTADGVPVPKEKKKRKKKKKSADGSGSAGGDAPPAPLTQVEGTVVDGKGSSVPHDTRISRLLAVQTVE